MTQSNFNQMLFYCFLLQENSLKPKSQACQAEKYFTGENCRKAFNICASKQNADLFCKVSG